MAAGNNLLTRLVFEAEDRASGVITKLGAAIAAYFAVDKIAGFFGSAVKGAADLEQQFSTLQAATGATADDIARLQAKAEELGSSDKLAVSAVQAAAAMTELGRAGQSSEQILASIAPVMALAQGAALDLGQAAGIVTANLAGFQLSAEESGRVADVLSTAASSAKTTVADLASALSYAAPAANAAGMSIEETTAIIAKMQNAGIDASRAGTALNNMLASLADPASTASKALDRAGISTRDFSGVLAALEQGGAGAERAIVAFGTEAGPALRALLAQGSGSVRELRAALNESRGSAEDAAATMNDNLAGAFEAVGSVWEQLKITLVQPLLKPLEEQARSLAKTLAAFSQSAQMEQLKRILVETFETGVAQFKAFASAVDWPAFAQSVTETLNRVLESIRTWGENIDTVKDSVVLAVSAIGTGIATLQTAFWGVVGVFEKGGSAIVTVFANIVAAQSKLTLGPLKWMMENAEKDIRALAARLADESEKSFERMQRSFDLTAERGEVLRDAWGRLNAPAEQVERTIARLADTQEQAAAKSQGLLDAERELERALADYNIALASAQTGQEAAGLSLVQLGQRVADARGKVDALASGAAAVPSALNAIGQAAEDTRTPLEQASQQINALEIAYQAFMSVGDLQGAVRIRAQIDGIRESLKGTADQADDTSEAVASAFRLLGIESSAALKETAEGARKAFETIRDSGTATPRDIQAAFTAYAQAAVAANGGVADSVLQSQAAQAGLTLTVDESGQVIVQRMGEAKQSVEELKNAMQELEDESEGASDAVDGVGESSESAGGAASAMRKILDGVVNELKAVNAAAGEAVNSIIYSFGSWNDKVAQIAKLNAYDFVDIDGISQARAELAKLRETVESAESAANSLKASMGGGFAEFYRGLGVIKQFEADVAKAQARLVQMDISAAELSGKIDQLRRSFEAGELSLEDYIAKLERMGIIYNELGDERLTGLRDAIADAKRQMDDFARSAEDGLQSLQREWALLNGQREEALLLEQQMQRLKLEEQLAEARARGNAEEIAALEQQLALLDKIHAKKLEQLREEDQERQRREQEREQQEKEREQQDKARDRAPPRPDGPSRDTQSDRTVTLRFDTPGARPAQVTASDDNLDALLEQLRKAGLVTA